MQYDLDINDIDSVQFTNHFMNTEQDMHILTDDEFESKLEELLDFVFGPEQFKFVIFFYESGKEWIFNTKEEAYKVADELVNDLSKLTRFGWVKRPYTKEIVIALVEEEYTFC